MRFYHGIHWSALERHDSDVKSAYKELGFVDSKGRIRQFDGSKFWPLINALGHDATDIEKCKCRTQIFRTE